MLMRDEQVIVMEAGDHITTQANVGEFPRDGGGETDRLKRRVGTQRDPARHVLVCQSGRVRLLLRHDQRQTLVFGDGHNRPDATWNLAIAHSRKHVAAGIELGTHTGQQLLKIDLTSHDEHPMRSPRPALSIPAGADVTAALPVSAQDRHHRGMLRGVHSPPAANAGHSRITMRLRLEPVGPANAADLWLVHNDEEVSSWYGDGKPDHEETRLWADFMDDSWRFHGVHKWIA